MAFVELRLCTSPPDLRMALAMYSLTSGLSSQDSSAAREPHLWSTATRCGGQGPGRKSFDQSELKDVKTIVTITETLLDSRVLRLTCVGAATSHCVLLAVRLRL